MNNIMGKGQQAKRLRIYPASQEQMAAFIAAETYGQVEVEKKEKADEYTDFWN